MRAFVWLGLCLPVFATAQPSSAPASALAAVCGDGLLQEGEACDDGNLFNEDLCRNDCSVVAEWSPAPSELKSPQKALRLSVGYSLASLVPLVGIPFAFIGPSAGQIYAKDYKRATSHSALRVAALGASVIGLGGLAFVCGLGDCDAEVAIPALGLTAAGVASWTGLTIFDIVDAPRAALRYNARLYHPSKREEMLPFEAASWQEKARRSARDGGPSLSLPKWLYGGAATIGAAGLVLGLQSFSESRRIRLDLEEAQSDGVLSLEESQLFADFPRRQQRARALSIGADTLFVMAIPLGAAGAFVQYKQKQIAKQERGAP